MTTLDKLNSIRHEIDNLIKELSARGKQVHRTSKHHSNAKAIIDMVNAHYGEDVSLKGRNQNLKTAKHAATYLLRNYTDLSWQAISELTSRTDHTSSIHSYKVACDFLETDTEFEEFIERAVKQL